MSNIKDLQINIVISEIEKRVKQKVDCFCVSFEDDVVESLVSDLNKIQFLKVNFNKRKRKQVVITINYRLLNQSKSKS